MKPEPISPATEGEGRSAVHVAHVIAYVGRDMGGPVFALRDLAAGLAAAGLRVTVAAVERPSDGPRVEFDPRVELLLFHRSAGGMFRWCPPFKAGLGRLACDVVHSHGLWTYAGVCASFSRS